MIEVRDISISFGNKSIVNNLHIHIEKGENVCLTGDSGKGKSTVLKALQGYVLTDKGEIIIDGLVLNPSTIDEIRKRITWIPQNINLPVNSCKELLKLMNREQHIPTVHKLLESLGLSTAYLEKNFKEISGGEKQRVIIAACLSTDKPMILMDEPTSALDKHSVQFLHKTIESLPEKTILSASHDKKWRDCVDREIEL